MKKYIVFMLLVYMLPACGVSIPQRSEVSNSSAVYAENFNQRTPGSAISRNDGLAEFSKVDVACGPDGSPCLRHQYEPSEIGSLPQVRYFDIPKALAYTLQYDVRFDPNFEFVLGGKLHGLTPISSATGCRPQVSNGWSARVMWRPKGVAELYIYDQSRKTHSIDCGWSYATSKPVFKKGMYHAVSLYVQLNTVGKADGIAELWLDGKKIMAKRQIEFRGVGEDTEIAQIAYSTFFGGHDPRWAPSKTVYASLDNVMVMPGRQIRKSSLP